MANDSLTPSIHSKFAKPVLYGRAIAEGFPVELSRRQLLGAGLCAGLVATTAKSTTLAEVVRNAWPAVAVPARSRVVVDQAIDPQLLARARASFDRHRTALTHTDV